MDIKTAAAEFHGACLAILDQPELPAELAYRMQRIIDRFLPVADKMYLKTVKGFQTVLQCTQQARTITDHLPAGRYLFYRQVTDLENTLEELLKAAYAFRIKAG
ncbi:MAG: hypothetical protein HY879_04035 [Deltaproteobacteria bacterium]|nr:hypothetical protein [Deltaproteobacteria bacterium]